MSDFAAGADRLLDLAETALDKSFSDSDLVELNSLLLADEAARRRYLKYCLMNVALRVELRASRAVQRAHQHIDISSGALARVDSSAARVEAPSPAPPFLSTTIPSTVGWFSSGWPVAYLIATVIFGVSLLIGSVMPVSSPQQTAKQPSMPGRLDAEPRTELVGRITGIVDCQWEKGSGFRVQGSAAANEESDIRNQKLVVALGDTFTLASGLMEITYDTGAKVILQGPVRYAAESNGGYLSLGRLTGRLEAKTQDPRPKTPTPSSFILHPSSFVIRTPTATVTDLGTEFGVEVARSGETSSHVFRGAVRVQLVAADGRPDRDARVLHENESARVDAGGKVRTIVVVRADTPADFVRKIPKRTMKVLDLVDVVAGGDGFSGRRDRGIDPNTGQPTNALPKISGVVDSDGAYHRVSARPFVDGVFVPDGRTGRVQLDSAGHTFDVFPANAYQTSDYVRPVQAVTVADMPADVRAACTTLGGIDYALPGHAGLLMHANKGITFDLQAIRRANPGWTPVRFLAAVGNTEPVSVKGEPATADVWVFVDGQPRFQRREINAYNGVASVKVPLGRNDRFLTLASTDGGNGIAWDWIMFGDPRLEMLDVSGGEVQRENVAK